SKIRGSRTVLTQDQALVGTPQYMAPEQATGANDEIDARTDIFALGAITFEMLAGGPPVWGDSPGPGVHAGGFAPPPWWIAAAIERALSKNREARFADVATFVKAVTSGAMGTAATQISGVGAGPVASPAPGDRGMGGTQLLDGPPSRTRERVTTPELP